MLLRFTSMHSIQSFNQLLTTRYSRRPWTHTSAPPEGRRRAMAPRSSAASVSFACRARHTSMRPRRARSTTREVKAVRRSTFGDTPSVSPRRAATTCFALPSFAAMSGCEKATTSHQHKDEDNFFLSTEVPRDRNYNPPPIATWRLRWKKTQKYEN